MKMIQAVMTKRTDLITVVIKIRFQVNTSRLFSRDTLAIFIKSLIRPPFFFSISSRLSPMVHDEPFRREWIRVIYSAIMCQDGLQFH